MTSGAADSDRWAPHEIEALFLEYRATHAEREATSRAKAAALADALLTESWRRLIGPAWRLVHALVVYRAQADELGPGEHLFGTLADVAALAGVSERTVQRWTAKAYKGAPWLACWLSWREVYMTRADGLPCRAGTVFRLSLEARPTHDLTPAPRPLLEALRAPWRLPHELPSGREEGAGDVDSNTRQETGGVTTFPPKQEGQRQRLRAEGRDVALGGPPSTLLSNTRHPGVALANARSATRWAKAQTVAERLGDTHSVAFWAKRFAAAEREGLGDGAIWAAVGRALEAKAAGGLRRSAAAYAVGVLARSGSPGAAAA